MSNALRRAAALLHPIICYPACVCQIINDISAHGVDLHILAIIVASIGGGKIVKRWTTFRESEVS